MVEPRGSRARRALGLLASAALVASAGCSLDDLQHDGRYCSPAFPCPQGFACVGEACVASTTADTGPPKDGVVDAPLDGPPVDRGPGKEGGVDQAVPDSVKPDKGPQPDVGCTGGMIPCGGACVNPLTDIKHCGGCDKACTAAGDRCQQGKCHCGDFKPLCTAGLNCISGACSCLVGSGSLCFGCCASGICHPGNTTSLCGVGGSSCKSCPTSSFCMAATCSAAGQCNSVPKPNNMLCPSGRCFNGICCTGCYDTAGNVCRSGTSLLYCGKGGLPCSNCKNTGLNCINQSCIK